MIKGHISLIDRQRAMLHHTKIVLKWINVIVGHLWSLKNNLTPERYIYTCCIYFFYILPLWYKANTGVPSKNLSQNQPFYLRNIWFLGLYVILYQVRYLAKNRLKIAITLFKSIFHSFTCWFKMAPHIEN